MTILVNPEGALRQLDEHIETLRRLLHDLEELRENGAPSPLSLSVAPYLDEWFPSNRLVPCLAGYPEGHPTCRSGRMARTSDLWVFAPDHGYARTLNRYWRVGKRKVAEGSAD
jgi:hypothetical protein